MFLRVSHGFQGLFYTFLHAFLQVLPCVSSRFTHFTFYSEFTCKVKCKMPGVFHGKITIPLSVAVHGGSGSPAFARDGAIGPALYIVCERIGRQSLPPLTLAISRAHTC